jgi:hypothetical protein
MNLRRWLFCAMTGACLTTGAQAQTIYGEIGYSPLSLGLSVPVIGLRASADPVMVRGLLGFQLIDSMALEVIAGLNAQDSDVTNGGTSNASSTAKVDQLYGVYLTPKFGLGPVELFGRVGMARTKITFKGLGSGEDKKLSYGYGVRLMPTDHLSLSADHMTYLDSGGASVKGFSLSLGLRF